LCMCIELLILSVYVGIEEEEEKKKGVDSHIYIPLYEINRKSDGSLPIIEQISNCKR
jgi:hypothetical protein